MFHKLFQIRLIGVIIFFQLFFSIFHPTYVGAMFAEEKHFTEGYTIETNLVINEEEELPKINNFFSYSILGSDVDGDKVEKKEEKTSNTLSKIKDVLANTFNSIKTSISNFFKSIGSLIKSIVNPIKAFFNKQGEIISNHWSQQLYYSSINVDEVNDYWQLRIMLEEISSEKKRIKKKDKFLEHEFKIKVDNSFSRKWSEEEYDWMGELFEDLPDSFFNNYGDIKHPTFVRKERNKESEKICAATVTKEYEIYVYDTAIDCLDNRKVPEDLLNKKKELDKTNLFFEEASFKHVVSHEMAHAYDKSHSRDFNKISTKSENTDSWSKEQLEFVLISWSDVQKEIEIQEVDKNTGGLLSISSEKHWIHDFTNDTFVSEYANNGYVKKPQLNTKYEFWLKGSKGKNKVMIGKPWEDFAESIGFYLVFPEKLEEVAPVKYEYLKNKVFNNKEYQGVIDSSI